MSRDSSSDSSQEIGRLNKAGSSSSYKKEDLTQAEMEEVCMIIETVPDQEVNREILIPT